MTTTEPYAAGDAPTGHSFATYLDADERNQLDARAATAEAERDEALDCRNVLRQQLDTAREDTHHDIARQLDTLAADPSLLRDWLTTCQPQPTGFGELLHALAEKLRQAPAPGLGSSCRAQEQPADARRRHALAFNALSRTLAEIGPFVALSVRERCAEAVLAALDGDEREG
ncbi:hypothetical protein DER29_4321 [Micromonospora sp. M71_S20]|uniref:hypothetical protein n=1 Tax=Micromonospora sp. M71_S20 TaxID=592872 RepID=UPI000EAE492F|nr:hypothetical protein [Micromonospora sp. M71_S20]RLK13304.1 hypothetical protein DER29_4321 [Micromonospora sp. M71_S20]